MLLTFLQAVFVLSTSGGQAFGQNGSDIKQNVEPVEEVVNLEETSQTAAALPEQAVSPAQASAGEEESFSLDGLEDTGASEKSKAEPTLALYEVTRNPWWFVLPLFTILFLALHFQKSPFLRVRKQSPLDALLPPRDLDSSSETKTS